MTDTEFLSECWPWRWRHNKAMWTAQPTM